MTNVFLFAGKYISEGEEINLDIINKMWNLREGDFERCNISKENFVYQICERSYKSAISGKALVDDEKSHAALRKMAGIGLYLMQQQRDNGQMDYDNFSECYHLIENSTTLKQRYPDIHDSLRFNENIKRIYEMQMRHLDERSQGQLTDVYDKYTMSERRIESDKKDNYEENR